MTQRTKGRPIGVIPQQKEKRKKKQGQEGRQDGGWISVPGVWGLSPAARGLGLPYSLAVIVSKWGILSLRAPRWFGWHSPKNFRVWVLFGNMTVTNEISMFNFQNPSTGNYRLEMKSRLWSHIWFGTPQPAYCLSKSWGLRNPKMKHTLNGFLAGASHRFLSWQALEIALEKLFLKSSSFTWLLRFDMYKFKNSVGTIGNVLTECRTRFLSAVQAWSPLNFTAFHILVTTLQMRKGRQTAGRLPVSAAEWK